jgi:hypothetical protein
MTHPNRLPFTGVLCLVDVPSNTPPNGMRGRRTTLTRAAVDAAIPTLIGMGLNAKPDWSGHDRRRVVGVISAAEIKEDRLEVSGYVFAAHFPEMLKPPPDLGMSVDAINVHVRDTRAARYVVDKLTFTGAAVMLRRKAAFRATRFTLEG